jgi:PIN domain nuclease of toxin-antitoxin system
VTLILDTHALIWFLAGDSRLTPRARSEIETAGQDGDAVVSAVSAMEVVTRHRLGKLPEAEDIAHDFEASITSPGFASLAITVRHAGVAGRLAIAHKDPFDRLLIAQALIENAALVSNEKLFDSAGVERIW